MEKVLKKFTLEFFGQGKHKITPDELLKKENSCLLDVRSKEESGTVHLKFDHHSNVESLNIPINEVSDRLKEIPDNKMIGIFCSSGVRAAIVYAYLLSKGFKNVWILDGGYTALTDAIKPGKMYKHLNN